MLNYRYQASDAQGHITQGRLCAMSEAELMAQLQQQGLLLLRVRAIDKQIGNALRLTAQQRINFLLQLELQLRAGIPLRSALEELADGENTGERQLALGLMHKIDQGATFASACADYPQVFSRVSSCLLQSGETSGQLAATLQHIVQLLKWQDELAARTRKLLLYPCFVLLVVLGVSLFLLLELVPQLAGFMANLGQTLPWQTRLLLGTSTLLLQHGPGLLLMLTLLAILSWIWLRRQGNNVILQRWLLQLPQLGPLLCKLDITRFARVLALLYRSGIPLLQALQLAQQVCWLIPIRQAITRAHERIEQGQGLAAGFAAEAQLPGLLSRLLKIGETTGAIDQALDNIGYFYGRDIEETIARWQTLIEPTLTVILGLLLGWIMMAVLGPLYDALSRIGA